MNVDGKKEFLSKLCSTLKRKILSPFLVTYEDVFSGINLRRYSGRLLLKILQNTPSFLYQRRNWSDSKPSAW